MEAHKKHHVNVSVMCHLSCLTYGAVMGQVSTVFGHASSVTCHQTRNHQFAYAHCKGTNDANVHTISIN